MTGLFCANEDAKQRINVIDYVDSGICVAFVGTSCCLHSSQMMAAPTSGSAEKNRDPIKWKCYYHNSTTAIHEHKIGIYLLYLNQTQCFIWSADTNG